MFVKVFGDITIAEAVAVIIALIFLYRLYKKVSDFLIQQHEVQKTKDDQLKEALESARKCPEHRQLTLNSQQSLEAQIKELKESQDEVAKHLQAIEQQNQRRERNKLRDRLLQSYRYYTNPESNPSQSWNQMESEAFWELYQDYLDAGGNGYMKNTVRPAMERLNITDISKK